MSDDCFVCGHLLQAEIDQLIQQQETDSIIDDKLLEVLVGRINNLIERMYGAGALSATATDIRVHALKHPLFAIDGQIAVFEDTQVVRAGDRYLTIPTLRQGIVTMIAFGLENIRLRPEQVKPVHTLQAMNLARQLGMTLGAEELEDVLQKKIAEPKITSETPMMPPDARNGSGRT
jgi:hypothetical protein